jgi:hypothetical protein
MLRGQPGEEDHSAGTNQHETQCRHSPERDAPVQGAASNDSRERRVRKEGYCRADQQRGTRPEGDTDAAYQIVLRQAGSRRCRSIRRAQSPRSVPRRSDVRCLLAGSRWNSVQHPSNSGHLLVGVRRRCGVSNVTWAGGSEATAGPIPGTSMLRGARVGEGVGVPWISGIARSGGDVVGAGLTAAERNRTTDGLPFRRERGTRRRHGYGRLADTVSSFCRLRKL